MSEAPPDELAEYPVIFTMPIQWGDQDAFGHVNNIIHIRWFESARVVYLEDSGLKLMLTDGKTGPILASITCNYRRQLTYPDTVQIGARVSRIGRSSMTMDHAVYSEALDAIAADGSSIVVVFDYEQNRPIRVPDNIRAAIEHLEGKTF